MKTSMIENVLIHVKAFIQDVESGITIDNEMSEEYYGRIIDTIQTLHLLMDKSLEFRKQRLERKKADGEGTIDGQTPNAT